MKNAAKVLLAMAVVCLTLGFVSCGKKGTCESCEKENVKLYKVKNLITEKDMYICADCNKEYKEALETLKKLKDAFSSEKK